ncbi:hypothetical protein [Nocardia africana]|uniref:Uncharacterized protein n=1 Tax=Nocardia africana TaxID=134964 RepID=A0ABW6NNS2_9NOCA
MMFDDSWEPWTGTEAELDDLGPEIDVIHIGCSGFSRAAARNPGPQFWIRRNDSSGG